jgi:hypothetical protein
MLGHIGFVELELFACLGLLTVEAMVYAFIK